VGWACREQFPESLYHATTPRNGQGPILAADTDHEHVLTEDCGT